MFHRFLLAFWGNWTALMSGIASIALAFWAAAFPPTDNGRQLLLVASIACLFLAAYQLWVKEAKEVDRLRGMPSITMQCWPDSGQRKGAYQFHLNNTADDAVNVRFLPITIPVPEGVKDQWSSMEAVYLEGAPTPPANWVINTPQLSSLAKGNKGFLEYEIEGFGVLQRKDLQFIFEHGMRTLGITLAFSNLSGDTWYSQYELRYDTLIKRLNLIHLRIEKVRL